MKNTQVEITVENISSAMGVAGGLAASVLITILVVPFTAIWLIFEGFNWFMLPISLIPACMTLLYIVLYRLKARKALKAVNEYFMVIDKKDKEDWQAAVNNFFHGDDE